MTAPPVASGDTRPTARRMARTEEFFSPAVMFRAATKILTARGMDVRPAVVRRLVTRFIREGHTSLTDFESFVVAYADPTGETAVSNVQRERGF